MEKIVPLKSKESKFFRQYVEILNPIILRMRSKELDVLSELLSHNNKLKHIDLKNRWKLILDYDNKKEIAEKLKISIESFGNILTALRKKGVIIDNQVISYLLVYPDSDFNLTFKFSIEND